MSKFWSFGIGLILVLIGLISFGLVNFESVPSEYLNFVVAAMGVLVLMTKMTSTYSFRSNNVPQTSTIGTPFNFIKRYIFGAFLFLSGFAEMIGTFIPSINLYISELAYGTPWSSILITLIGVIFIFSSFHRTRALAPTSY